MHLRGGGNGNPLQYSCLENPMDGGALLIFCLADLSFGVWVERPVTKQQQMLESAVTWKYIPYQKKIQM